MPVARRVNPTQTKSQAIGLNQTKSFFVHLQNDGVDSDTFRAFSTITGPTNFRVWFFVGTTDVTGQVTAGTFNRTLASGAQITLEIRVKAKAGTPASAIKDINLTWQSKTASAAKDVVRAHVSRA